MGGMRFALDAKGMEVIEDKLGQWSEETSGNVRKAVEVSGRNIKDGAAEHLRGHMGSPSAIKHLPGAIGYEFKPGNPNIGYELEIEPKDGRMQSPLGAIIEGGTPTSPPKPFMGPALKDEQRGFYKGVEKALMEGWDG